MSAPNTEAQRRASSERLKALWADPVWRAQTLKANTGVRKARNHTILEIRSKGRPHD